MKQQLDDPATLRLIKDDVNIMYKLILSSIAEGEGAIVFILRYIGESIKKPNKFLLFAEDGGLQL